MFVHITFNFIYIYLFLCQRVLKKQSDLCDRNWESVFWSGWVNGSAQHSSKVCSPDHFCLAKNISTKWGKNTPVADIADSVL